MGRFSLLRRELESMRAPDDEPLIRVTARNRENGIDGNDPLLAHLDESDIDQLWLFAVDTGDGITRDECAAIERFRKLGGGIVAARDHADLGISLCSLGGIGEAEHFHSRQQEEVGRRIRDDMATQSIEWPNYHSGANGNVQRITVPLPLHEVMHRPGRADESLVYLPAHPHEGAVSAPASNATARVIAMGTSAVSGRRFATAVAFSGEDGNGRAIAESTFHHFLDYNWNVASGCPSFVEEPPGDELARKPELLDDTRTYVRNIARWLGKRTSFDVQDLS